MLKQHEAGRKVPELAREIGVSEATIYTWKLKYVGMDVSEAQRLKGLEDENRRLKQLVADLSLDKEALKAIVRKTVGACRLEKRCGIRHRAVPDDRAPGVQAPGSWIAAVTGMNRGRIATQNFVSIDSTSATEVQTKSGR